MPPLDKFTSRRAPSTRSILNIVQLSFSMLSARRRTHWLMLIPLAVISAALESFVAVATYGLLQVLSDPKAKLPGPTELYTWLQGDSPLANVRAFIIVVAVSFIAKNVFVLAVEFARNWVVQRSVAELSERMFEGYIGAPYVTLLSRNSADFIRNVTGSVDSVFSPVLGAALYIITESLIAVGIVGVLIAASPRVTLMVVAVLALSLLPLLMLTRRHVARWGAHEHGLREGTLKILHQAFGGIKEVKIMGGEAFFAASFRTCMDTLARLRHLFYTVNAMPRLLIETLMIGGMLLLMAVVLTWGTATNTLLALFGLYGYAAFRLIPSANRVTMHINQIRHGGTVIDNLHEDFTSFAPTKLEAPTAKASSPLKEVLRLNQVTFRYPNAASAALHEVDLCIQKGECVGIAGSTGAGKTTLVDVILGLLDPSAGQVEIDGVNLPQVLGAWRSDLGYVPQHIYLTDDTFIGNIAFGVPRDEVDRASVERAVERAQLGDLIRSLPEGLETVIGERGTRLSGGERQRVGIARALYHDPSVIIFDEATSALDNRTEREVMQALSGMRKDKTLILIAHRLTTIQSCDRLFFLANGRVVAHGPYEQLLAECEPFRALVQAVAAPSAASGAD